MQSNPGRRAVPQAPVVPILHATTQPWRSVLFTLHLLRWEHTGRRTALGHQFARRCKDGPRS
eukprot:807198-Alexandrium_andersonii.AAC.1